MFGGFFDVTTLVRFGSFKLQIGYLERTWETFTGGLCN
jgi:hypothetical protein